MKRRSSFGVVASAVAAAAALAIAPYGSGARPASAAGRPQVITGGMFGVGTRYTAGGGDTWFNTWSNDGNIYATSNDTSGFNGKCNSDLAVNELAGSDPTQLTAPYVNCMSSYGYAGDTSEYPDGCDWKSGGIMSVSGVLYLAVARQTGVCTNAPNGEQPSIDASIVKSSDHGRTWSNGFGTTGDPNGAAPPLDKATGHVMAMFPRNHFSAPFFIQYGQDDNPASTADGGDKYVYAVSNDGFAYDGSYLYLSRVLRSKIGDLNAADWQFYTGPPSGNGLGPANWSSSFTAAKPILAAKNQVSQPEIQYLPTLHRYVLINFYYPFSTHWPGGGTASSSTFSFYESPHPWGPWTRFLNKPTTLTVCYIDCQPNNTMPIGFYDPTLVSKFIRMEGLSNVIFTSGDFTDASRYGDPQLYALHELPLTLSSPLYDITDDSSPAITYKGSWADSTWQSAGSDYLDGTLHSSGTPGDSASYRFTGSSIEWIGSTNNNHGYAAVSVDGGAPTMVDTYSPGPAEQVSLFKRTGLTPGRHSITITVTSQHDPAAVLYDFANNSAQGWQPGPGSSSVQVVHSFANAPGTCYPDSSCLAINSAGWAGSNTSPLPADVPRIAYVTPASPLDLQGATSVGTYIDGYSGAPQGQGYAATLTLSSGTHTLTTTRPVQANSWNAVTLNIGDWPYRDHVTKIAVSFNAVGTTLPWVMQYQIGLVFTGPVPPFTRQEIDAFIVGH